MLKYKTKLLFSYPNVHGSSVMPRRKSAESLKRQCLFSIARDMDKVWSSDFYTNFRDVPRLFYVIGPFYFLTTELTQDLINILAEQRWLKRHHLQILLHTHLKQLDLEVCRSIANHDSVIRMVGVRCQTLSKLNLSSLNQISAKVLVDLVLNVPHIQSLILQNTKCNDQVMATIGRTCSQLRELNVFGCPVTDSGAFGLCLKSSANGGLPNCSQLVSLDIGATAVSLCGASAILQTLQCLRYFHYCDVCAVLEKLYLDVQRYGTSILAGHGRTFNERNTVDYLSSASEDTESTQDAQMDLASSDNVADSSSVEEGATGNGFLNHSNDNSKETVKTKKKRGCIQVESSKQSDSKPLSTTKNPQIRTYAINSLTATGIQCATVTAHSIKFACQLCPNVTEVYLHQNIGNSGMAYLTQLQQLSVLEVVSCAPDPITFEEGLVPVLKQAGPNLIRLTLYDFADIDIIRIGQYCPQLQHLTLESSMCDFNDYDANVLRDLLINGCQWQDNVCPRDQPAGQSNDGDEDDDFWGVCRFRSGITSGMPWSNAPYRPAVNHHNRHDYLQPTYDVAGSEPTSEGLFAHLRSLRIILLSETNNFPADILRLILTNARHLVHLHLTNMQFLTDDLLAAVLLQNPLSSLQTLVLEMCNNVDRRSILRLLNDQKNGLQRLDLIECQSITRRDFEHFLDKVGRDNVDVTITWM